MDQIETCRRDKIQVSGWIGPPYTVPCSRPLRIFLKLNVGLWWYMRDRYVIHLCFLGWSFVNVRRCLLWVFGDRSFRGIRFWADQKFWSVQNYAALCSLYGIISYAIHTQICGFSQPFDMSLSFFMYVPPMVTFYNAHMSKLQNWHINHLLNYT